MDWSNYDNELFKKNSENLFDDYIDNRIECGNLIEENNNYMNDYEIKPDEFILEKSLSKPQTYNHKGDLNFENFYGSNFTNENMDFSDSKISEENTKTKTSIEKYAFDENEGNENALSAKSFKQDKLSNKLTEYSSSPFINNQTSTNNYSNMDDSKSQSSDSASNSNKKSITNDNKNSNNEENENEKQLNQNFINYQENLSMQNNNFSECHEEEMNFDKNKNNKIMTAKAAFSSVNNNMIVCSKGMQDKLMISGNMTNNLMLSKNGVLFTNQNQNNVSLSERMKTKIQRAKELLEKKQYKACENLSMSDYYGKNNGKNFQYNLESAHEFSELKNNNVCKKSECPDCLSIMSRINYMSNNFQSNASTNGPNNSSFKRINTNQANTTKNNISRERQNLPEKQRSEKSSERNELDSADKHPRSILSSEENSAALVKNSESKINLNNESFSSNGTSRNSGMEISLNENSFSGICNRNNLSKKELKMLRNRISAQKSRDRKKKEMDDLKLITQELFNQNIKLKKQLEEKENKISEFKEMFNSLCENCRGKLNSLNSKNRNSANYLLEENKLFLNSFNSNSKYLDVGESIELSKKTNCAELNKNINDLKNNLISNKRNRVVDFPSIMNNGNRKISSNVKCGIMTGFLVIACIVGSFAFNYGFSFVNQHEEFIVKHSDGFTGRLLQEISNEDFVKSGNYSTFYEALKSDYLISSNETFSTETVETKNKTPMLSLNSDFYNSSKSLAIYKKKDDRGSKKISIKELNEISQKRNSDYYNTIRNKINLDYYLQLSKQIVDKVDKNIYDLTYLTDLSEDSKNAIAQNMIEHVDKINKFFEIKLNQFANNDFNELNSSEFAFLGKKRLNFMQRNKFENRNKKENEKDSSEKDSAFLKYSSPEISLDEKCFEPKGVRYTISDLDFGSSSEFDYEEGNTAESAKASKKYFKYNTENSNIRNVKYENLNRASDSKSLIVKKNLNNNKDVISLPYIMNSNSFGQNENVNSLYCKDFMSLADENSEFFRRIFAKLDLQKKADILREQLDLNGNIFEDVNKNREGVDKISFNQKNDDDCLYLHMILPENNNKVKDSSSGPQEYKMSNSSSFNRNYNSKNNSENKQVFYEVGCKIFEINKIYK